MDDSRISGIRIGRDRAIPAFSVFCVVVIFLQNVVGMENVLTIVDEKKRRSQLCVGNESDARVGTAPAEELHTYALLYFVLNESMVWQIANKNSTNLLERIAMFLVANGTIETAAKGKRDRETALSTHYRP